MSEKSKSVVTSVIKKWSSETCGDLDGVWYGYAELSDETGIPRRHLRSLIKQLVAEGVIAKRPCYDDDGVLNVSGYFYRFNHN